MLDELHDACCSIHKQDIPEVESVISLLRPAAEQHWNAVLDGVVRSAVERENEQGPEWLLALMAEVDRVISGPPAREVRSVLRSGVNRLRASSEASVAVGDLLLLLKGRWQIRRDQISAILDRRLPEPQLRLALSAIFDQPIPRQRWLPTLLSTWAYRWYSLGGALSSSGPDTQEFRYTNPLTPTTTPFCRWLVESGRKITLATVREFVNDLRQSQIEGEIEQAMEAAPILDLSKLKTEADFREAYENLKLRVPGFHWGCRTQLAPA